MEPWIEELSGGWPDAREAAALTLRLLAALLVGAIIGMQRESTGKPAGLRTHILVALGTALFIIAASGAGMAGDSDSMSRVIQGVATGLGFLGAGAILKLHDQREIKGLTTAAGIWLTAAASVAAGLGRYGAALVGAVVGWAVLAVLRRVEQD